MKRSHIVLLVLVVAALAVIASSFANFSSYETFKSAGKEPGKSFQVMCVVARDKGDIQYDAKVDANHYSFYGKDKAGNICKVIANGVPQKDMERSEQVVMTGFQQGDVFHCSSVNLKCPSKYKKQMATNNQ